MAPRKGQLSGDKNPNWRNGRTIASNGYVLVKRPGHPLADVRGYVYEHRLVAEQMIGRPLLPGEQIHHINHDKTDNRPENLQVMASIAHHALAERRVALNNRLPDEPNPLVECACGCGTTLPKYDRWKRPRQFVTGHNTQARR